MKTKIQLKELSKESREVFSLVKGEYDPGEASEILNALFTRKINFHESKCFSSEIRFGEKDTYSEIRIKELKHAQAKAGELIDLARASGKAIRLNSEIFLELI
ncbi:hypothetical protein [Christiangramia fulva]|nr:hypothetical protein [Christiangramia fulva]